MNKKNKDGYLFPLLWAISNKNVEIVKLLIEYANQHQIILELNEKNKFGDYPLLWAIFNVEIIKLLIEYANQYQIIMELNEKNNKGGYPLLFSVSINNIEIVKLLIDYANQYRIILEYSKKDIGKNIEIQKLLQNYEKEKGIRKKVNI